MGGTVDIWYGQTNKKSDDRILTVYGNYVLDYFIQNLGSAFFVVKEIQAKKKRFAYVKFEHFITLKM